MVTVGATETARREERKLDWLFETAPEARDAIRQRLSEYPEYRSWLQQFSQGLLQAVE